MQERQKPTRMSPRRRAPCNRSICRNTAISRDVLVALWPHYRGRRRIHNHPGTCDDRVQATGLWMNITRTRMVTYKDNPNCNKVCPPSRITNRTTRPWESDNIQKSNRGRQLKGPRGTRIKPRFPWKKHGAMNITDQRYHPSTIKKQITPWKNPSSNSGKSKSFKNVNIYSWSPENPDSFCYRSGDIYRCRLIQIIKGAEIEWNQYLDDTISSNTKPDNMARLSVVWLPEPILCLARQWVITTAHQKG